ncbi:hypothetical protein NDU88_000933 [Pleurodeles waltl]|uniref:J domain-containing protein n=1 Tax=Pleurodeles waltl TaxID=8319 RepID=A0AAV7S5X9_PLEWA|nr:hypothetical protein NDU88_000933 [Pleurodeles waltl]
MADEDASDYVNDGVCNNAYFDWPPQSVSEKQRSTCDAIPKSGTSQGENLDPLHLYSANRTHSCGLSCYCIPSEQGHNCSSDPAGSQDGQEDFDEDVQYDWVGLGEDVQRQHIEHSVRKKGGKRQRNRSVTKDRDEGKDDAKKECRAPPVKHRAARKRSQVEGRRLVRPDVPRQVEELALFCVSFFRKFIDLIVFVTHRCGEYVESGGILLYTFCQLKTCDMVSVKSSLQNSAQVLGLRSRGLSMRLKQWGCSWGMLAFRLLKMLCALLFLVLMLFIGCLRLCWRPTRSALLAVVEKVCRTGSSTTSSSSSSCLQFVQRLWDWVREWRTCKYLIQLLQKWLWLPWTSKKLKTEMGSASTGSPGAAGRAPSGGEMERLLSLTDIPEEDLNPFQVLGVEMTASDMELKKAYRQLAVLVHPDKNTHPRAEEAFKVVRAAWDIVSNPEKRKEYEIKRMSESELAKSMTELLSKLQDDLKEAMNTMMCSKCQGKHKRFEMERDPLSARYCAECNKSHPAEEGDFWAESSMLGLKITYFAMMDGKVYDITEWAGCQRVGISPDTHRVPYHISFGSKNSGTTGRPRTVPESPPASAADLQDLFNRIFQGPPGPIPNGGFFATPQQAPPHQAASAPNPAKPDSLPKTETKPKKRKKVRRPFQR